MKFNFENYIFQTHISNINNIVNLHTNIIFIN